MSAVISLSYEGVKGANGISLGMSKTRKKNGAEQLIIKDEFLIFTPKGKKVFSSDIRFRV